MAYTKPLVTTTVNYHNGTDPVVFADAISSGVTTRYGSTARQQLLHGDAIDTIGTIGAGDPTRYVIPYHAVVLAEITVADSASQTEPEDEFCIKE